MQLGNEVLLTVTPAAPLRFRRDAVYFSAAAGCLFLGEVRLLPLVAMQCTQSVTPKPCYISCKCSMWLPQHL
jgi:hypothetical protein